MGGFPVDLRDRLRFMRAAGTARPDPAATDTLPPVGATAEATDGAPASAATEGRAPESAMLGGLYTGELLPTPAGPAFALQTEYPREHHRGRMGLEAMLTVPAAGWTRLGRHPAWADFDPTRAVFFDTETTGLERASGTYIFLAGVGKFEGDTFRVRQFFMRDYHEEEALLQALLAEFAGASAVVTFNGRGFDWPLLLVRATMNRLRVPDLPHLDLLFPARRLWKTAVESCRLVQLEAEILGEQRHGDTPGYMIPQLYFHYLQTGDAAPLGDVLLHNRLDILSLAALGGYLGLAAAQPRAAAPMGKPLPGSELFALGRLLLEGGELAEGIACLEEALARGLSDPLRPACQKLLAGTYRRAAQHARAVDIWWALARESGHNPLPLVELAKHYEHREKDPAQARRLALQALELVQRRRTLLGLRGSVSPALERDLADITHRLQRLDAKLKKCGEHGVG